MLADRLRHTSEDVGRAITLRRTKFLPEGRLPLRWSAAVMDWAYDHMGPAELARIKEQVDSEE